MKQRTRISWADFTLNPWEGCTRVSEGCRHCYAEARDHRYSKTSHWGPGAPRRRIASCLPELETINRAFAPGGKRQLLEDIETGERWIHQAEPPPATFAGLARKVRPQVFSLSLGDILDPEAPTAWLSDFLLAAIRSTNLDFLLLTKRPEVFQQILALVRFETTHPDDEADIARLAGEGFPHIAWGTSVENDQTRHRIAALAAIPAPARFLSCEPLIGPVDLADAFAPMTVGHGSLIQTVTGTRLPSINLVLTGGESGPTARPMHPDWVDGIDRACREAVVPHHFKQWGGWAPHTQPLQHSAVVGNLIGLHPDGRIADPGTVGTVAMVRCRNPHRAAPLLPDAKTSQPRLTFLT